ncbi:hypothetical protein [Anaerococcus hydrogenalis]|uniref:hypothetical protein n=1 Tax=Anaerococcus hydrogenalis TaxID=33029 RepID=UPI0023F2E4B3|nr:hypothetical protein [Anaerococcus hydrogenalis]
MSKKKILIIAETGISSELFKEKFQHFINISKSCACVELTSLNTFVDNLKNKKYTHILVAPNAHILEDHIKEYLRRVDSTDTKVELISETDYITMNVEKIMLDQL